VPAARPRVTAAPSRARAWRPAQRRRLLRSDASQPHAALRTTGLPLTLVVETGVSSSNLRRDLGRGLYLVPPRPAQRRGRGQGEGSRDEDRVRRRFRGEREGGARWGPDVVVDVPDVRAELHGSHVPAKKSVV